MCVDCTFKPTRKLDRDILCLLNQSKTPGRCGFPLANPQKGLSRDFVPKSMIAKYINLFYICSGNLSFW